MERTPAHAPTVVSVMPMALIRRIIASVRVVFGDTMFTEYFAARQSRVGPLWPSIEALLEPFLIIKKKNTKKNRNLWTGHSELELVYRIDYCSIGENKSL
jgi:hypothetical protein